MRSVAAKFSAVGVSTMVGASAFVGMGALTTAGAPSASAAAGCTNPASGVTVVVQFTTGTAVGCAPGSPASALDALRSAGFSTTGTVPYGDAVLCSINGKPFKAVCPVMPPTDAYWAVFSAKRGGSWTYSSQGVTSLQIPAGGVVGFHFGNGSKPSVAVPAAFPTTSNTKAPAAVTTKSVAAQAPAKSPSKPTAKPSSQASASKPTSAPSHSAKPSNKPAATSSKATPSQKANAGSHAAAPMTSATSTSAAPTSKAPVVKATQTVHEGNATKVVVTYNDGSKATVAPSAATSAQYRVGATKSPQPTSMAKMSTQVPTPSNTSHPSIWTSGSVPVVPAAKGSSSNLPGIIAGVGVVGAVAAGGAVAIRRRG